MNQVVRYAGMVRVFLKESVENGNRFLAIGEGGVVGRLGAEQRKRIERRCFVVLRRTDAKFCHRMRVGGRSFLEVPFAMISTIKRGHGVDVASFARRFGADGLRLLN